MASCNAEAAEKKASRSTRLSHTPRAQRRNTSLNCA